VGFGADARVFAFELFNHHFGFPGRHKDSLAPPPRLSPADRGN
jgi:hypothetical protein